MNALPVFMNGVFVPAIILLPVYSVPLVVGFVPSIMGALLIGCYWFVL